MAEESFTAGTVFSPTGARSFGLAHYLGPPTHTLTVTPGGQGSIASTPAGIACPPSLPSVSAPGS